MIIFPSKRTLLVALCSLGFGLVLGTAFPVGGADGCVRYDPVLPNEPTGIKGCVVYGEGVASRWQGPGVARNDCVYPWTSCQPVRVTSVDTGLSIIVIPTMYCDCFTGTADERIIDLGPTEVAALGLDPARGLYPVVVEPVDVQPLPDTRTR